MPAYSPLKRPENPQAVDNTTGRLREDWLQFVDNVKKRLNAIMAILGFGAVATNATAGFLYVPTCAGTPTGTPDGIAGMAPLIVDSTNNRLYFYSNGAWRNAGP